MTLKALKQQVFGGWNTDPPVKGMAGRLFGNLKLLNVAEVFEHMFPNFFFPKWR